MRKFFFAEYAIVIRMEYLENIVEYYDELFPIGAEQSTFFDALLQKYADPVKVLRIGCGTGAYEHALARKGFDVTGIDSCHEFIDKAIRRRRLPNETIRFFQMTAAEIGRFLAKDFYRCIMVLEGFIYFIRDPVLLRKFFYDCHGALKQNGVLVLHLPDITPVGESMRVKLISTVKEDADGFCTLTQTLEHGNSETLPVRTDVAIHIPSTQELSAYAEEAGFGSVKFYKDWNKEPCRAEEASIWVLR